MNKQLARNLLRAMVHAQVLLTRLARFGNSAETIFDGAWNALRTRRLIRFCASHTRHRFQPDVTEVLLLEVFDVMKTQGSAVQPRCRVQASDTTLALLDSGRAPLIVVTNHTGFSASTRALLRRQLPVTLVTDALPTPNIEERYKHMLGKYPNLQLVPKDRYCLARLREALRDGRTISCAADFQDNTKKTYSLVSPAIFAFANRLGVDLLMSKTVVNDDGSITTVLDGPHYITNVVSSAEAFIRFLNEGRRVPRQFHIGQPPPVG